MLLQWFCLGRSLNVITWPMGFIIVAKNQQVALFAVEAAWATFNVAATWWGRRVFGLEGAGIAFLLSYVFHALIVYPKVRGMTGFQWSGENLRAGSGFLLACAERLVTQRILPQGPALGVGTCLPLASQWYCVRALARLSDAKDSLPAIRRFLRFGKTR